MRFNDFDPCLAESVLLNETALKIDGLHRNYVENLIALIKARMPIKLTTDAAKTYGQPTIQIKQSEWKRIQGLLDDLKDSNDEDRLNKKKYLDIDRSIGKLETTDKKRPVIALGWIDKSTEIKGKGENDDYNVGDMGEIALAVAATAKFLKLGEDCNVLEFVQLAKQLRPETVISPKSGKVLSSLKLEWTGTLAHASGKEDILKLLILAPGRSVKSFVGLMDSIESNQTFPQKVKGTILSAIQYAHDNSKIKYGIEKTAADPNTNTIEVICDGVSDQKGTKADLLMDIDGERINILSAKTGPSQLGQASGHSWEKQHEFFKVVFGVDVSAYKKDWGNANEDHLAALYQIWQKAVIPKVLRLAGGNSVAKEIALVQDIGNGLIRYSNNYDEKTNTSDTIDIVKLVVDPGSPGYSLMHVDRALAKKLETTDLKAEETASGYGVKVVGIVEGVPSLLFKARSYHSKAGNVIRTIIEGGDLLDELATVPMAKHVPATPAVSPTANTAPAPAVSPTANTVPAPAPTATTTNALPAPTTAVALADPQQPQPPNDEEKVAEQHKWQPHKDEHVSELQRMLHLAKYSH
jgi:hypothetical protein